MEKISSTETHKEHKMETKTLEDFEAEKVEVEQELVDLQVIINTHQPQALKELGIAEKVRDAEQKLVFLTRIINTGGKCAEDGRPVLFEGRGYTSVLND